MLDAQNSYQNTEGNMRKKIRDEVQGVKKVVYRKKPELWLDVCDGCGKLFSMQPYCNDNLEPGRVHGTFDGCYRDKGNQFFATVCSLECAHKIFTGGWKLMREYKGYAKAGLELVRVAIGITSLVKYEDECIQEWEEMEEHK